MKECKAKRSGASTIIVFCLMAVVGAGLLAAVLSQPLHAQVLYGSVSGTVSDPSGAVVPGAQVTIVNDTTGFTRTGTTDSAGYYRLLDLSEGTYTLTATASGFQGFKKPALAWPSAR